MALDSLEAARKAAKKSQEQFASDLGMDQAQYTRLESGAQIMGESVAQRLARHLPTTSASSLLIGNKVAAYKRAQERGIGLASSKRPNPLLGTPSAYRLTLS